MVVQILELCRKKRLVNVRIVWGLIFVLGVLNFFVGGLVLGLELRASDLLGRCSLYHLNYSF
jgi:hypothetical protein